MVFNLRKLDLNLLVVFDAIADERSVTRAAAKLHMTQPAISHPLGRLRIALGDDLFVRTPEGMEPTPFALRLSGSVLTALRGIQAGLLDASIFDPASSERSFSIAVDNRSALVLTAPIIAAVSAEGPSIRLDLRPSGTLNLPEQLDRGDLDLALGGLASSSERFRDLKLFDDGFVALVRVGHPAALGETIGIHALGEFPHLSCGPRARTATSSTMNSPPMGWPDASRFARPCWRPVPLWRNRISSRSSGSGSLEPLPARHPSPCSDCPSCRPGRTWRCSGIVATTTSGLIDGCVTSSCAWHVRRKCSDAHDPATTCSLGGGVKVPQARPR